MSVFLCSECGATHPAWSGQCSSCKAWNSLNEIVQPSTSKKVSGEYRPVTPIADASAEHHAKPLSTKLDELDVVLGGGLMPGSAILLGGEPGIGKSTLALQVASSCSEANKKVLYITAEESPHQIKQRGERIDCHTDKVFLLSENNLAHILSTLDQEKPDIIILDSIQMVYHPALSSSDGTVQQVRYCTQQLIHWIKAHNTIAIIIGHITKEGSLAGPKVLEHLVDTILYFEGERSQQYRLLRSYKNRYGSTNDIGIFEMSSQGLINTPQPGYFFLNGHQNLQAGSIISPTIEGSRAFLVEVQALTVSSGYGMAKRNFVGMNQNRTHQLIATIEKNVSLKLSAHDIFVNVVGGFKIQETALDLATILAIITSYHNTACPDLLGVVGEVGLTGEIRPVPYIEKRIKALEKLGFTRCIIPKTQCEGLTTSMELCPVTHLSQALQAVLATNHA